MSTSPTVGVRASAGGHVQVLGRGGSACSLPVDLVGELACLLAEHCWDDVDARTVVAAWERRADGLAAAIADQLDETASLAERAEATHTEEVDQ